MVGPAVLGAAVGTGLALLVTLTIVTYRYYVSRNKMGSWYDWEQAAHNKLVPNQKQRYHKELYRQPSALERSNNKKYPGSLVMVPHSNQEFVAEAARHVIQPPIPSLAPLNNSSTTEHPKPMLGRISPSSANLPHQSCSLPVAPRLSRTESTTSQQAIDYVARKGHRGSSPQIRTYSPELSWTNPRDGSEFNKDTEPTGLDTSRLASSWSPVSPLNRSPSPVQRRAYPNTPSPAVSPTPSSTILLLHERSTSPCLTSLASLSPLPSRHGSCSAGEMRRCFSPFVNPFHRDSESSLNLGSNTSLATTSSSVSSLNSSLGGIQPELYKRQTTVILAVDADLEVGGPHNHALSVGKAYSEDGTETERKRGQWKGKKGRVGSVRLGKIHFRLCYDFDKSDLIVHIIEVHDLGLDRDLYCGNHHGLEKPKEPFLSVRLTPEVDNKRRHTPLRFYAHERNPYVSEQFKFPVGHEELGERSVILEVCDYDRFSRQCVLGDLQLKLANYDVLTGVEVWGEVSHNTRSLEDEPQILLSLSYLPSAERLTAVVLKAKNLAVPSHKDSIDPTVKLYLVSQGKRIKKKKTQVRKGNVNPIWNEAVTFCVTPAKLSNCSLEVCVLDNSCDRGEKTAAVLGTVVIGPEESNSERQHWLDMSQHVRKSVAMWHVLH